MVDLDEGIMSSQRFPGRYKHSLAIHKGAESQQLMPFRILIVDDEVFN